jgi:hypothetical protein
MLSIGAGCRTVEAWYGSYQIPGVKLLWPSQQLADASYLNQTTLIIVLGETHLRRVLKSYADYYNWIRTHRSLNKNAPVSRPVQRIGVICSRVILGGLHHRYACV